MDETVDTVPAGEFRQKCLALIDRVAATGTPIVISKDGTPIARLVPLESPGDREERILQDLRAGSGGMPVDEQTFLAPTSEIAGWADTRDRGRQPPPTLACGSSASRRPSPR